MQAQTAMNRKTKQLQYSYIGTHWPHILFLTPLTLELMSTFKRQIQKPFQMISFFGSDDLCKLMKIRQACQLFRI